jgi:hypothetical protein
MQSGGRRVQRVHMCLPPQSLLPPCYPGSTMCHTTSSERHTTPHPHEAAAVVTTEAGATAAPPSSSCLANITQLLWPPKPKLLLSATRTGCSCAAPAHTTVGSTPSSGLLMLMVGCTLPAHGNGWVSGWSSRCHPTLQLLQQGDALVYIYPYAYAKAVHTRCGQACSAATSMLEAAGIHAHMQEQLRCRPHLFESP